MPENFWLRKCETSMLAMAIAELLKEHDPPVALAALNYCMAGMIHVHHGTVAEDACKHSDEQTRWAVKLLRGDRNKMN